MGELDSIDERPKQLMLDDTAVSTDSDLAGFPGKAG